MKPSISSVFLKNQYLRFILCVGIAILIFIFIFQKIDIYRVTESIRKANLPIVFIALTISIIESIFFYPYRWKLILKKLDCDISLRESVFISISCSPIANILPLKTGEFSRAFYLKRLRNIPYSKAVFSIFCEYMSSFLTLFIFIFMGLIGYLARNISFAILRNIGVLFLLPLHLEKSPEYFPNIWRSFLNKLFLPFKTHLKSTGRILRDFKIGCCSFLSIGSELVVVYLLAKSLDFSLPVYSLLLYIPLVMLISHIPLTIEGLGIREAAILFFFAKFASAEKLLSSGILYSFIEYLFPTILGIALTGLFLNKIVRVQDDDKVTSRKS